MKRVTTVCAVAIFATQLTSVTLASASQATNAVIVGRVVDASTQQVMPCTVTIHTSGDSIVVENLGFEGGFRSSGQFEKAVPPGRTRVEVSRGFDYIAQLQVLDVHAGQRVNLKFALRRRANLRRLGWYCGDNHVHMSHGERKITTDFPYVALAGRAAGLDYMSIAQDWNLPDATSERLGAECSKVSTPDFILTWNMEAPKNYWKGDVSHCLGHGWTLGMRTGALSDTDVIQLLSSMNAHDYESEKASTPNFEVQAVIHALGGIVSYTHPCRWWWGKWGGQGIYAVEQEKFLSNLAQELPYDTVIGPTYDTIDILMQTSEGKSNEAAQRLWLMLLNRGYRIPATASTDATFDNPGGAVPGKARVYTHLEGRPTIDQISRAMGSGRNFVTSGPLLIFEIGGREPGGVIHTHASRHFEATTRAWASGATGEYLTKVEVLRNGEVARVFRIPGRKTVFTARFDLVEGKTASYIARCFGSNADQIAVTNPIYFEGRSYRRLQPIEAHILATVTDRETRKPLDGHCEVVNMIGLTAQRLSSYEFKDGRLTLDAPGTARLLVQVPGYAPMTKSAFMDYAPLLNMVLNMREAELTDWSTFEEIASLLSHVQLDFQLTRSN